MIWNLKPAQTLRFFALKYDSSWMQQLNLLSGKYIFIYLRIFNEEEWIWHFRGLNLVYMTVFIWFIFPDIYWRISVYIYCVGFVSTIISCGHLLYAILWLSLAHYLEVSLLEWVHVTVVIPLSAAVDVWLLWGWSDEGAPVHFACVLSTIVFFSHLMYFPALIVAAPAVLSVLMVKQLLWLTHNKGLLAVTCTAGHFSFSVWTDHSLSLGVCDATYSTALFLCALRMLLWKYCGDVWTQIWLDTCVNEEKFMPPPACFDCLFIWVSIQAITIQYSCCHWSAFLCEATLLV